MTQDKNRLNGLMGKDDWTSLGEGVDLDKVNQKVERFFYMAQKGVRKR